MGKNKTAVAARGIRIAAIDKLKAINNQLMKEMANRRKQIAELQSQMDSLAAEEDILAGIKQQVFGLVLAYSPEETEMASVRKKWEYAAHELKAAEMRLLALVQKDAIETDMNHVLVMERDSKLRSLEEQAEKKLASEGRKRKKWFYPAFAVMAASFCAIAAAICCFKDLKKNISGRVLELVSRIA